LHPKGFDFSVAQSIVCSFVKAEQLDLFKIWIKPPKDVSCPPDPENIALALYEIYRNDNYIDLPFEDIQEGEHAVINQFLGVLDKCPDLYRYFKNRPRGVREIETALESQNDRPFIYPDSAEYSIDSCVLSPDQRPSPQP